MKPTTSRPPVISYAGEGSVCIMVRGRLGKLLCWLFDFHPPGTPDRATRSLINHEFDTWRFIGDQVPMDEFTAVCFHRGFNREQSSILRKRLIECGLGEELKSDQP